MNKKIVVVYHDPCLDGMGSRYVAWKAFGADAHYMPGKYEDKLPLAKFKGKEVICVDFSYKCEAILQILEVCTSLTIYDHHATAFLEVQEAHKKCPEWLAHKFSAHYDMEKSGIGIAWEHLRKGFPMLSILAHLQDRDLWKFEQENTVEVCCYMESLNFDFKKWVKAIEKENYMEVVLKGKAIRQQQIKYIEDVVAGAEMMVVAGHGVPVVTNCPKKYISESCHLLLSQLICKGQHSKVADGKSIWPFSANRSWNGTGWLWSLRSDEGGLDVGKIAQSRGGGGHKHAAGFFVAGKQNV